MEDEKLLKYAIYLMNAGNKKEAAKAFMVLVSSKNEEIKLQAMDALLSILDQIKDYKVIMTLCDNAINISKTQKRMDNLAYFQMRKASTMSVKIGGWKYVRKTYKLSPNWFNFSTEEDKQGYKDFDDKIKQGEKEVDRLCIESLKNAKVADNKKLLGMIYLYRAPIWQNRCSDLKIERMLRTIRFLPECRLKDLLRYNKKDLKKINQYFSKSISDLFTAIKIFKEIGDKDSVSYCYNNLTNCYLHSYRYVQAFFTFKKLESNIKGSKDEELLRNYEKLKDRLKNRNKNIPNYVDEYKNYMTT
ncbi:MAG TPA: hypothetical protein VMW41_04065 [Candidatus Bathyarchaeia archaeon]|nr:hypothetical protein [Candidatus Bathyarchaeia archaeon]